MKNFDLHPKPATSARKKSVLGGILTSATLFITVLLLFFRAREDFGKRTEDVSVNTIAHAEKTEVSFDISFLKVQSCNSLYKVEVLDALGRVVADDGSNLAAHWWAGECKVSGIIHVPAGKGTFRIYPSQPSLENIYAHHRVDKLGVGTPIYGVDYYARLLKTDSVINDRPGAWSYFLSLVPTTSNGVDGYQIAATRNFVELSNPMAARGSVFFYYDSSPVRMYLDSRLSISKVLHFIARAIGIISGLFAFVGAFREIFINVTLQKPGKKKKSNLVM
jgi:hypothetical protein